MSGNWIILRYLLLVLVICSAGIGIINADSENADILAVSTAPINPEYLDFLERMETDGDDGYALGYIPPVVSLDHLIGKKPIDVTVRDTQPAQYDLRTLGRLTPVRNQGSNGTCWAFATLASLESSMKPGQEFDFSEKNVVNRNLWLTGPETGGNYLTSGGYLAAWMGPVNETTDPYPGGTWNYISPSGPVTSHVQEIFWIPGMSDPADLDTIKDAIISDGALMSSFNWTASSYDATHSSYYCPTCTGTNHGINLVGWDDTFNRNNFTTPAPGDGAFLMRNSWGSGWGDGGYGWISYHDPTIGKANAQFIGSDVNNYSGIYQYDPAGKSNFLGVRESTGIWGGNVFIATEDANLTAVGFYTNDLSADYDVRIYKNPITGPVGATILSEKSGTIPMSGYHTIPLDTPVRLSTGDIFSIVLNLVNPSYELPLSIEDPANGPVGNNWTANPGEGYFGPNGNDWTDIVNHLPNASICIKGYTNPLTPPVANFTAHPISGPAPLRVQFTDTSTGDPTSWLWQFGDGSISPTRNPFYSYVYGGNYTVNLTVENEGGSDTKSVLDYIQVTGPVPVPPVASFTSNVTTGQVPLPVQFTDTSGNEPTSWLWEFGDGANSSVRNPVHVYSQPGSYTVNLTASNPAGCNLTSIPGYISATWPVMYPHVTGISPNSGQVGTGVSYTITGNNLQSGALVNLTKSSRSNISSIGTLSGSNLTGTFQLVPGTVTGLWNVSVNQAGRYSNDDVQFSVLTAPTPVPPVAGFSGSPRSGVSPLTVQFTDQSLNNPTIWFWDFGDGSSSTIRHPEHTYTNAGSFTVSLNASNSAGSNLTTAPGYITVTGSVVPPVAGFTGAPRSGVSPLSVQFSDQSLNNPTNWFWDFGDGSSSTIRHPEHTYTNAGSFTVSLNASNSAGSNLTTAPGYINVTSSVVPPVAGFSGIPRSGVAPLSVQFSDQSLNNPTIWFWDFGDGSSSTIRHPEHTYTNAGSFTVSLNASNSAGSNLTTAPGYITVTSSVVPPVAGFSGTPRSGSAPLNVQFTDESLNNPTSWNWSFGEGSHSAVQNPSHTFTSPGLYAVSLEVSNAAGSNVSAKQNYLNVTSSVVMHTINATAGLGGVIIPSGLVQVPNGGSQIFTILPEKQYEIVSVFVDGQDIGPVNTYTFTNVVSDHQISAEFKRIQYNIIATSDRFTYVHPYGLQVYPEGANASYYTGAIPGSVLEKVIVNGTTLEEPVNSYTFMDIVSDNTIATEGNITPGSIHVSFDASPMAGSAPLTVQFTDQTLGDPVSWYWDFGDGKVSREKDPSHIYTNSGSYTVQLRVYGKTSGGYKSWNNAIVVR